MDNMSSPNGEIAIDDQADVFFNMTAIVIFHWIVWGILSHVVVIFGIISNIINIVCFVKQGFKDSINVSLTGLAISDLGSLLPLIWTNLCYTPAFTDLDLPFDPSEMQYMTSGATHLALTRVSSWITAAITFERCLCVAMPLRVKEFITPKRALIIITSLFIVLLVSVAPQYYYYRAGKKYYPERNRTLYGIIFSKVVMDFEAISFPINFVIIPYLAFIIIIVCTVVLVIELKITQKWREKSATSANMAKLTRSKNKVATMVVMISGLFIGSYAINVVIVIVISIVPGFSVAGKFRLLIPVVGGVGYFFEIVNASINIFIYYHMSMKFRKVFNDMMCLGRQSD